MTEDPSSRRSENSLSAVSVGVVVKDRAWLDAIPPLKALAREAVAAALERAPAWKPKALPAGRTAEVSVCFADDDFVRALNREFRDKDKPTNVLSFPGADPEDYQETGEILLGDIVLALGVVAAEAEDQKKSMTDHTTHLVVHGLLHLLGYTHDDEQTAMEMETLEVEILGTFGIGNPYR